jgi:hypothetical protein
LVRERALLQLNRGSKTGTSQKIPFLPIGEKSSQRVTGNLPKPAQNCPWRKNDLDKRDCLVTPLDFDELSRVAAGVWNCSTRTHAASGVAKQLSWCFGMFHSAAL